MYFTLHSDIKGSGPTLVLLHGFLSSSRYFSALIDQLSADFTVISIDLLGHGKSTKKATDFGLSEQVSAIHQTLADLHVTTPFAMLGHSLGALITLEYLQTYEKDVSKLILLNPSMFNSPDQAYKSIVNTSSIYKSFLFSKLRKPLWQTMYLVPPLPKSPLSSRDRARVPTKARDDSLQAIVHTDFFSLIGAITTKTLVIVGAKDRKEYHENIAVWSIPNHVQINHNSAGHHYAKFEPAKASQEIREFLTT